MTSSRDISGLGSSNGLVVCSTGKQSQKQECERFLFCAREKSVSEEHLGVAKDSRKTGKTSFVCCAFLLTCPIYLKSMVDPESREPSLKERRVRDSQRQSSTQTRKASAQWVGARIPLLTVAMPVNMSFSYLALTVESLTV